MATVMAVVVVINSISLGCPVLKSSRLSLLRLLIRDPIQWEALVLSIVAAMLRTLNMAVVVVSCLLMHLSVEPLPHPMEVREV
jgi:hypothetical protein